MNLFLVLVLYLVKYTESKYVEGHLRTSEKWEFLTRFCFLSQRGKLEFEVFQPSQFMVQNILLYFDDQWPHAYKTDKTCLQKESVLRRENNQVINLTTLEPWSGCQATNTSGIPTLRCAAARTFRSVRERWWFVVISNCAATDGLNLQYKITMTNGRENDFFYYHFSADEFYILQVDIAFLLAFFAMFLFSIAVAYVLSSRQLFHTTYKLYMVSLVFQVFHLFFKCINYGVYAQDGVERRGLFNFARALDAVSILTFILMLILMGKGYTITRGRISQFGAIKITVFMTLYIITYAILFIYEAYFFDPGLVLYLYESPPGYGLIGLRILSWIWFCYAIFFTLKHYPEKSSFYYPFFIFYTIWFWAGPVVIFIAMRVMNLWVREKVVSAVEDTTQFVGYVFFMILTRPSAANKNFPYHVRTSQIGVMSSPQQNGIPLGASRESESFSPHPYAVAAPPDYDDVTGKPNFSDMFVTSNTRGSQQQNGGTIDKFPHVSPASNPFITSNTRSMSNNNADKP